MARGLRLTKSEVVNVNLGRLGGYRLRIEASDPGGTGADPNVFLFLRGPLDPHSQEFQDRWQGVAGPVDMADYPVGEPDTTTTYPYYRTDTIEVDLRAACYATEIWAEVVTEVSVLLEALDCLENLTPTESVDVGTAAESTGGSSSSSSSSGSGGSSSSSGG
jgi:hypothetical protein